MELYVFFYPHFFCGLAFPTLLLTSQFQTNLLASVLLLLWFQKIFLHLFTFPPRTSSPFYFCRRHFRHDDLLWVTCSTLLFSARLLVQHRLLEPLSLQKNKGKQGGYCTMRKGLSISRCSGFYYWGMQHQTPSFTYWNLIVLILRMHNCNNSFITLVNNIIQSKKMCFSLCLCRNSNNFPLFLFQ